MDNFKVYTALKEISPRMYIGQTEQMSGHTYVKTGGKADFYVKPQSAEEVQKLVKFAFQSEIPLTVIGKGSNVIIRDGGIRGIVMNLDHLNTISVEHHNIVAGSGVPIIDVSHAALHSNLSGLEFACGIPGSTGGALRMNAGAYDGEISEVLVEAAVLTMSGDLLKLKRKDFQFGYRTSIFKKEGYIVLEAHFRLERKDSNAIKEKMDLFTNLREQKQPLEYPSCGSVFKRPPNHFAGKLIADSYLQGVRIGGAEVSKKHSGFIINADHATSTDYLELIELIKKRVKENYSVDLETEVEIIGEK